MNSKFIMLSGRQVMRVPIGYKHPTQKEQYERFGGEFPKSPDAPAPIHLQAYDEVIREWWNEREAWLEGKRPEYCEGKNIDMTYEEYAGGPPDPAYYLISEFPEDAEMGIQLWETISEGSPLTPVFPDTDDGRIRMSKYMEKNDNTSIFSHLTSEEWLEMINGQKFSMDVVTGDLV